MNLLEYLYRQLDMQDKPKYLKNKHSIRYDINNIDFNNNNLRYLPCYIQPVHIEPTYAVVSKNHRGRKSSSSVQPSSSYAPPRPTALKPGRKPTSYEEDEVIPMAELNQQYAGLGLTFLRDEKKGYVDLMVKKKI